MGNFKDNWEEMCQLDAYAKVSSNSSQIIPLISWLCLCNQQITTSKKEIKGGGGSEEESLEMEEEEVLEEMDKFKQE